MDGFGVVLEREDGSRSVIRIESIAAVDVAVSGPGSHGAGIPLQMAVAR